MTVPQAIAKFNTDPEGFLKKNLVVIAGGNTRLSSPTIFKMQRSNTLVKKKGFLGWRSPMPSWSVSISQNNGGNPGPHVALAADEFVAYYIPMKQQGDSVANIFGQPPTDGSVALLLTSQLSGCTFGFSNLNGSFVASHLQPVPNVPQVTNRQNMRNITQQGMSGSARLVQKGLDYTDQATIVGAFRDNAWKLYMQPIDWNPGDGTNGFKEIKGITRL